MQTRYESSSNPTESQHSTHLPTVKSIATSELSPAVKTSSLVGLVVILFATLMGSLVVSPSPETIAESEETESVTTSATEETSPIVVESVETETPTTITPVAPETDIAATTTPTTTDTESAVVTPDSEVDLTLPNGTQATTDSTASTLTPEIDTEATTTITPETETEIETTPPTADETVSTPDTSTPGASGLPSVTSSPSVEATQPTVETDAAAIPESQPDTLNPAGEAADSEIAASSPETATEAATPVAATSEVDTTELSQSLYNQIDSTWTSPVDGESVYVVKLNSEGDIIGYEAKSQVAKNNLENTPLPELVNSDAASTEAAAQFEVVFSTSGILEVKSPQ
ncbi:hypothetical protein ACL6C3_05025 [Capilliphycus salinus ALCB114379]|uniref:hypothetical protein n=1 Tax=Capilliphycus salinus TaxID=2768948 RepID=UPI0039A50BB8